MSETSYRSGITKHHLTLHKSTGKTPEGRTHHASVFWNFIWQTLEGRKRDLLKIITDGEVSH